ncbi:two-component system histidine kinase PnpS [Nitrospira sp. Kam-Ns4a]
MILSIRWKVALGALMAATLSLAIAGWLTVRSLEQIELASLSDSLAARTSLAAHTLGPLISPLPATARPDAARDLQRLARELGRAAAARVTVMDMRGVVLADSDTPDEAVTKLDNHLTRPEVQEALATGQGTDIRLSQTTGQRMFYFARAVRTPGGTPAGIVRLSLPLTALEARIRDVRRALAIALAVAFALSLAASVLLARGLTRPLSDIAAAARRLARGDLSQRIRTSAHDEVGVLAATLNQMAEQLEAKIREVSEDRSQLLAMLTAMVEGVMVLDYGGRVLQVNPALERMFGLCDAGTKGRPHRDVIRHDELNELVDRVLETQRNQSGEITIPPGGRTLRVQASVAGFRREAEPFAVLVFHDVTALRRLETVRKDFVANVSHELRTPLTSIKGYVEALLDGAKDHPEQAGRFLEVILKQTDRLNLILDDLLQLSQIESGQVQFKRDPVRLKDVVERTVALIAPLADKKGHRLTVAVPADLPAVMGDEDRLAQVLTNLLDNAVKYTPPNGAIHVAARAAPLPEPESGADWVELSVADTGLGIPEADRPRIFERFYRVDKARSRELGGTGLGLAIVKHIVEAHSGRVWVETNEPTGSRFVVRLPAARDSEAGA